MVIGVNSRIYQNSETGIPYFVKWLFQVLLKADNKNNYIFFQTNETKKLGKTVTLPLPNNILCRVLFDTIFSNLLALLTRTRIFHGPANILPIFRVPGIKYMLTIHDLSFLVFPDQSSGLFTKYYRYITRKSAMNADLIVADSFHTRKDIVKYFGIPKEKIHVVHLGINSLYFDQKSRKRLIRKKYFFSVNTHPKRKNIFSVLEAMASNKELQKYKYVIAGLMRPAHLIELNQKIESLGLSGCVTVYGYAAENDLISLYQHAEFLIYPSFYEGFGLPVVEAMASGCPVIVSNTSSLVEIVPTRDWSVNPYSIQEISDKMLEMLRLSARNRKSLIKRNSNYARKFTWGTTAMKYQKLYELLR